MCCEPRQVRMRVLDLGDDCCCEEGSGVFFRRFRSTKEKLEWLEAYREDLKSELQGVEERIEKLKGK